MAIDILVSEVGPRDGLQSVKRTMPTAAEAPLDRGAGRRRACARSRSARSCRRSALPQMADCAEVVRAGAHHPRPHASLALVPNLRYAQMAFEAGAHQITIPVSVSEPHLDQQHPQEPRRDHRGGARDRELAQRALSGTSRSRARCRPRSAAPSRAWCRRTTWCGWRRKLAEAGVDTINLADTVGYANPAQVKRLFTRLRAEVGDKCRRRASAQHARPGPRQRGGGARRGRDAPSTRRWAASAAAPMRRAPPATSSPRTWCSCSRRWGSTPASTSTS